MQSVRSPAYTMEFHSASARSILAPDPFSAAASAGVARPRARLNGPHVKWTGSNEDGSVDIAKLSDSAVRTIQ